MSRRTALTILTLIIIIVAASIGIFLAKGYRISPQTGTFQGTGIISATSEPDGASIFIDGHLTSATNATIPSLPPKTYTVKIVKEGFIAWEKKVEVKEGLVSEVKVTLFPAIPTVYPLTFNGVVNPTLALDGERLAFGVPLSEVSPGLKQRGGVWVLTMVSSQPISFNRSSGFRQVIASSFELDFSKASFRFSPDSKQLLVTLSDKNFLLPTDQQVTISDLRDIAPTVKATLRAWDEEQKSRDRARVVIIRDLNVQKIASASAVVKWSPDETKFFYREKPLTSQEEKFEKKLTGFKVYDLVEKKDYQLPEAKVYIWLPNSRHIILVEDSKISIADYDGGNLAVIYAGNFLDGFVFPWPDSSKLVMLSSLPTPTAQQPNLFGINLK